jgi:RimJ/RimL family protein N-acetyltransferase
MQVFLETERLWLRRFTDGDVDILVDLDGDPAVMRYVSGGPPTPREVLEHDHIPAYLDYYRRYEGFGFWAAIEKASGVFLGWFHFRADWDDPLDHPEVVELGYRLKRSAWGKGYATEGSRALVDKGFAELGVQRVVAFTYGPHLASRRVMEKVGMRLTRTYRLTPEELREYLGVTDPSLFDGDDVEYAITKDEWAQQQAAERAPGP